MKYKIEEFTVNNYRSISSLTIKSTNNFLIICGANNVGKTNFLRAMKLFFLIDEESFVAKDDIPYHIVEATRGAGYKTTLKAKIRKLASSELYFITQEYTEEKGITKVRLRGKKGKDVLSEKEIKEFLGREFKFFLIGASNINIPSLISEIVNDEILPIGLRRRGQSQLDSLTKLEDFIKKSKEVVSKIEKELTGIFKDLFTSVDSINSKDWKLKIIFPEYNYLREAISNMIDFTLFDTNEKQLDSKGSGIQRIILLSLIQYINKKAKEEIIWAIDEPEAFLQPSLQKSLFKKLKKESSNNQILITTHSNFFIDLNDLDNTFVFECKKELRRYIRKPGKKFFKLSTEIVECEGFEKSQKIKSHFGLDRNDAWDIMPYNLLVEGLEDKNYLTAFLNQFDLEIPNILVAGGVNKYRGYLQYVNDFCSDLDYKPKVIALFDKDSGGRQEYDSLSSDASNPKKLSNIELLTKYVIRFDGESFNDIEIEDLIYPELLFDAVNKILRKKGYSTIKREDRNKRTSTAYNKKPILDFVTEFSRLNNEHKEGLDFTSHGMKLYLCKLICDSIKEKGLNDQDKHFPKVKDFLIDIIGFVETVGI